MHHALGPMPGTSLIDAAEVIAGECAILALPQLPDRGVGSDAVGRTAALLPFNVEAGPRAWQLVGRPQLITRRVWDRLEEDLDQCEATWGTSVEAIKVQVMGPWSLSACLELSNGHRAITDRGAVRDIREGLEHGVAEHIADVQRRFEAHVTVQVDEPLLGPVIRGELEGTTQWDSIPPIPEPQLMHGDILHLAEPLWQLAPQKLFIDASLVKGTANLDGFGALVASGVAVGLGITPGMVDERLEGPRSVAVKLGKLWDELGLSRDLLGQVDVYPVGVEKRSLLQAADALRFTRVIADMLVRDAGDL